ncbi:hypothetical protein L911_2229 [Vibrio fluvialis I21563]|nr:hypothetical protein L911_2229 [Vibrio fluvialis I21563]
MDFMANTYFFNLWPYSINGTAINWFIGNPKQTFNRLITLNDYPIVQWP